MRLGLPLLSRWSDVFGKFMKRGEGPSSGLAALSGRFPFSRDLEKGEKDNFKGFRPISRRSSRSASSVLTGSSEEASLITTGDLPNPFADYLADDAKVWTMYLDLTKSKGEELMRIWNSDLDTILIFAGLFSAILTAFLVDTRQNLQQDPQDLTNALLEQVIQRLSPDFSPTNASILSTPFVPSTPIVWVNGLWFVSMTFSLVGAFGSILAKGWVAQFIPASAGVPIVDACNRHRRFFGEDQHHVRSVIAALPITLHIAFYLFFAGLVILLTQDDPRIAIIVSFLIAITMLLYLGCSVRPFLNPNSPFRTPISGLLPVLPGLLLPLVAVSDIFGHFIFPPHRRRLRARRIIRSPVYTKVELLCLSVTNIRRLWTGAIMRSVTSLYKLMLASKPPSNELRAEVLVGLFSLSRSYNLSDPVCALAGLPITPKLQEALYNADPLPSLTRNLAENFLSSKKTESPDVTLAYLTVLLSLVQTTNSSLNWTASALVPLLKPGGILSWELFQGEVLELVMCIQIHVYVRSGLSLPAPFMESLPNVVSKCTKSFHQHLLAEACLILSAIDGGIALGNILEDDSLQQMLLGPTLGPTFEHMIKHPQKRVQRAVLKSVMTIAQQELGCAILIEHNILKMLLDYIPHGDPQFQAEGLLIFSVFLRNEETENMDGSPVVVYEQSMLGTWIESIFDTLLTAMLKSGQLNVQEAAITTVSSFLDHEYPREEFLRLDLGNALISMFEAEESSLQTAAMRVLKVLLSYDDARAALNQKKFGQAIALALDSSIPQMQKDILDFILNCFSYDEIKNALVPELQQSLVHLFRFQSALSELTDKLMLILYNISSDNINCSSLLTSDIIFFLLNTLTNVESFTKSSINMAYYTLKNVLHFRLGYLNFFPEIKHDTQRPLVLTHVAYSIIHLLESNDAASQILSIDLLFSCLPYFDLRQYLKNSKLIFLLGQRIKNGNIPVRKASLNALLGLVEYDQMKPAIINPVIVDHLLSIVWEDWTDLSEPALKLLTICMKHSNHPITLLPDTTSEILAKLIDSGNNQSILAALTVITECAQYTQFKNYQTIMKFLSTQIIIEVTELFCSTNLLDIQEQAAETLHHIIISDHLRPILLMENFVASLLSAAATGDIFFQLSSVNILYLLAKHESGNPFLDEGHINILKDLLLNPDDQLKLLVLRIIPFLSQTVHECHLIAVKDILTPLLSLGDHPDRQVSRTALHDLEVLFASDKLLRHSLDLKEYIQLILRISKSSDLGQHLAIQQTFATLMKYDDIHGKVICSEILGPIFRTLHRDFDPLLSKEELSSMQKQYLSKILQIVQEASSTTLEALMEEDKFPSLSATDLRVVYSFKSEGIGLRSYLETAVEDRESSIFFIENGASEKERISSRHLELDV